MKLKFDILTGSTGADAHGIPIYPQQYHLQTESWWLTTHRFTSHLSEEIENKRKKKAAELLTNNTAPPPAPEWNTPKKKKKRKKEWKLLFIYYFLFFSLPSNLLFHFLGFCSSGYLRFPSGTLKSGLRWEIRRKVTTKRKTTRTMILGPGKRDLLPTPTTPTLKVFPLFFALWVYADPTETDPLFRGFQKFFQLGFLCFLFLCVKFCLFTRCCAISFETIHSCICFSRILMILELEFTWILSNGQFSRVVSLLRIGILFWLIVWAVSLIVWFTFVINSLKFDF